MADELYIDEELTPEEHLTKYGYWFDKRLLGNKSDAERERQIDIVTPREDNQFEPSLANKAKWFEENDKIPTLSTLSHRVASGVTPIEYMSKNDKNDLMSNYATEGLAFVDIPASAAKLATNAGEYLVDAAGRVYSAGGKLLNLGKRTPIKPTTRVGEHVYDAHSSNLHGSPRYHHYSRTSVDNSKAPYGYRFNNGDGYNRTTNGMFDEQGYPQPDFSEWEVTEFRPRLKTGKKPYTYQQFNKDLEAGNLPPSWYEPETDFQANYFYQKSSSPSVKEHFKDKANKDWKNMKKNSKRKDGKYGEEE